MCGGPSSNEKDIAKGQQDMYKTLNDNYKTTFSGQQNILTSLQSAFSPIMAAGIGQYGFTPAEDAALRTQASAGTAGAYKQAAQATGERFAGAGGGNEFLPTGAADKAQREVALAAAGQESSQQLGITTAGYEQGRQNFLTAAGEDQQVAAQLNPIGYAGQSTSAGSSAFSSADTIYQEEQAASPWNIVGGVLGGALQTGIGAFTGGIGMAGASAATGGGFKIPSKP